MKIVHRQKSEPLRFESKGCLERNSRSNNDLIDFGR